VECCQYRKMPKLRLSQIGFECHGCHTQAFVRIMKISTGSAAESTSTAGAPAVTTPLVDSATPYSIVILVDSLTQSSVHVAVLSPSRGIRRMSRDFTEGLAIPTTLRLTTPRLAMRGLVDLVWASGRLTVLLLSRFGSQQSPSFD
jgi:hypothetical protein